MQKERKMARQTTMYACVCSILSIKSSRNVVVEGEFLKQKLGLVNDLRYWVQSWAQRYASSFDEVKLRMFTAFVLGGFF